MTSFISSSNVADASTWRQWLWVFVGVLVASFSVVSGLLLLVDPYDSGRFPSFGISGVVDESPRTANVSRGRDSNFNAAIFGTSTGQLLDPRRLSQATGLSFVQLTVPGSTAREQLTLLRWFIDHHKRIGALVIASDDVWCEPDPDRPLQHPFPFWLYDSDLEYLGNVLRPHSFDLALRRIKRALGLLSPTDPAGYVDYEAGKVWSFDPASAPQSDDLLTSIVVPGFPWIASLNTEIAGIPRDVSVVLVMPPTFASFIPPAGSRGATGLAHCKDALKHLVAGRPHSGFLDFRVDDTITRDPRNFMDHLHYRGNVARLVEAGIAATILAASAR